MTASPTAYAGRTIAFATMHGKDNLALQPFRDVLGATIVAPHGLDTDQFGTFAGDIPRTLSPRSAARAKARLGMQIADTPLGLASEGSFTASFGPVVEQMEILLFIDDALGLELVEGILTTSPLPAGCRIRTTAQACDYAQALGFPTQGVILQSIKDGQLAAYKDVLHLEQLVWRAATLLADGWSVTILPDYRAHRSPTRADTIRTLCARMAQRLTVKCTACHTPGFGQIDVEHGLPCSACGAQTQVIAADIHGCGKCTHERRVPRPLVHADPTWCDSCNP